VVRAAKFGAEDAALMAVGTRFGGVNRDSEEYMHSIGNILLIANGIVCSYAASMAGLRILKEPARSSVEDFRALGLFSLCMLVAGWAFVQ
jgi:hypothetical protein